MEILPIKINLDNISLDLTPAFNKFADLIVNYFRLPLDSTKKVGKPISTAIEYVDVVLSNKVEKKKLEGQLERLQLMDASIRLLSIQEENIIQVLIKTKKHLPKGEVSGELLNTDWLNNFFDHVKNISSKEIQELWARILAGEICQPGSFSIRTLRVLRDLSQREAEIFSRISKFSFKNSFGTEFILMDYRKNLFTFYKLNVEDYRILSECGLLQDEGSKVGIKYDQKNPIILNYGNIDVSIELKSITIKDSKSELRIDQVVNPFTQAGKELLSILRHDENPGNFRKLFFELMDRREVNFTYKIGSGEWIKL